MRIARTLQLPQSGGLVHKTWRTHNKEYLLASDHTKYMYMDSVVAGLKHKSVKKEVKLSAYCVMDNHCHQLVSYAAGSASLSKFMQVSHSFFGQRFNRLKQRQGPVAYDRASTPVIDPGSVADQMRVHFYIEANPLRAKMTKNLRAYRFCSHKFYAWGIKDEFTRLLEIPKWYLALGRTWKKRQSVYRKLFNLYLKEGNFRNKAYTRSRYIGPAAWVYAKEESLRNEIRARQTSYG